MSNLTKPSQDNQLSLFDYRFESSIRRVLHDEELYFSLVDIVAHFSESVAAGQYWRDTKKRLDQDGFDVSENILHIPMTDKTGVRKQKTDCGNLETCLRIIQSIPHKNAEPVRRWLAQQGVKAIENAAQHRRDNEIDRYKRAGLDDRPEVKRLIDRDQSIRQLNALKAAISKVCDKPRWAEIHNSEYLALFGEVASTLKAILKTDKIRDGLPSPQLNALRYSESLLEQVISQQNRLSQLQILDIIEEIVKPIGNHLQEVSRRLGVHPITGAPLLGDGEGR